MPTHGNRADPHGLKIARKARMKAKRKKAMKGKKKQ